MPNAQNKVRNWKEYNESLKKVHFSVLMKIIYPGFIIRDKPGGAALWRRDVKASLLVCYVSGDPP